MTRNRYICNRCAESLVVVSENGLCVWCTEERAHEAVSKLIALAGCEEDSALGARARATDLLRRLGFTRRQVLYVRAQILEARPAEEIVKGLVHGVEECEGVAA